MATPFPTRLKQQLKDFFNSYTPFSKKRKKEDQLNDNDTNMPSNKQQKTNLDHNKGAAKPSQDIANGFAPSLQELGNGYSGQQPAQALAQPQPVSVAAGHNAEASAEPAGMNTKFHLLKEQFMPASMAMGALHAPHAPTVPTAAHPVPEAAAQQRQQSDFTFAQPHIPQRAAAHHDSAVKPQALHGRFDAASPRVGGYLSALHGAAAPSAAAGTARQQRNLPPGLPSAARPASTAYGSFNSGNGFGAHQRLSASPFPTYGLSFAANVHKKLDPRDEGAYRAFVEQDRQGLFGAAAAQPATKVVETIDLTAADEAEAQQKAAESKELGDRAGSLVSQAVAKLTLSSGYAARSRASMAKASADAQALEARRQQLETEVRKKQEHDKARAAARAEGEASARARAAAAAAAAAAAQAAQQARTAPAPSQQRGAAAKPAAPKPPTKQIEEIELLSSDEEEAEEEEEEEEPEVGSSEEQEEAGDEESADENDDAIEAAWQRVFGGGLNTEKLQEHPKANIPLTRGKMKCLAPLEWLNDEVINCAVALLQDRDTAWRSQPQLRKPACHFFSTFFLNKLWKDLHDKNHRDKVSGDPYNYNNVRRWTTANRLQTACQVSKHVLLVDRILMPVHCGQTHWAAACVDIAGKQLLYFDSLGGSDSGVLGYLARWVADEARDKAGAPGGAEAAQRVAGVADWPRVCVKDVPRQNNGCDCGVFSIKFMACYSAGRRFDFSQAQIPAIRRRLCHDLLRLKFDADV